MDRYALETDAESRELRRPRVLVFSADDALFSFHLAGVETVYDASAVDVCGVKTRDGRWFDFLLHHDQPALLVDVRELFGLGEVLGEADRRAFVVLRSRDLLLALGVDECIGVRDLDLGESEPVATALERENGLCVGHVVALDGEVLTILDPEQLLGSEQRRVLADGLRAARLFQQREARIDELWEAIRQRPTAADLRAYARLCRRNGHTRTAAAARQVLKLVTEAEPADGGGAVRPVGEQLAARMLATRNQGGSADLVVVGPDGAEAGRVFVREAAVVDAAAGAEWGRPAVRRLLGCRDGQVLVEPASGERVRVITESVEALLITSLEALHEDRRGRGR